MLSCVSSTSLTGSSTTSSRVAGRALAHRIEGADRLQRVAEQVEPQRLGGAGREEIDQAAAHGELAGLHDRLGPAVAVLAQELRQPGDVERLALAQHDGRLGIEAARRHPLQRRARRGQHDARRRAGLPAARPAGPGSRAARPRCRDAATAGRRAGSPRPGTPAPRARARRSAGRPAAAPAAGRRAPRAGCPARRWCGRARPAPGQSAPSGRPAIVQRPGLRWIAARVSESDATRTSHGTP